MKIYRIEPEHNKVQVLFPVDENLLSDNTFIFDCLSKLDKWEVLNTYIFNPKVPKKSFYSIGNCGAIVFEDKMLAIFQDIFEMCGEILPLKLEREPELYLLNVLDCRNGLNYETTQWDYYDDGTKGRILKFGFHPERIMNESSIFKIPEVAKTHIFTYSGVEDEEDEFYGLYKKHKLTGLVFEEVYSG